MTIRIVKVFSYDYDRFYELQKTAKFVTTGKKGTQSRSVKILTASNIKFLSIIPDDLKTTSKTDNSQELQLQKPISSLADIDKLQTSLFKDELSPEVRKYLSLISTKVTSLKAQIREMTLNYNEAELNVAIKFCDEHASKLGKLGKHI